MEEGADAATGQGALEDMVSLPLANLTSLLGDLYESLPLGQRFDREELGPQALTDPNADPPTMAEITGTINEPMPPLQNQANTTEARARAGHAATDGNNQDPTCFRKMTTALSQGGGSAGEQAHTRSLFGGGTWSDQERKLLKGVIQEGPFLAPIFFDDNAPCTAIDRDRFANGVAGVVQSLKGCHQAEDKTKAAVEKSLFEDIAVILKGNHEWLPAVLQAYLEQCPVTSDMGQETQQDTRISVMEHFKQAVLRIKNRMDGNGEPLGSLAKQQLPPHIPIIPRPKREWQMVQPEEAVTNKSARETNSDGDANAVYLNRDLSDHN